MKPIWATLKEKHWKIQSRRDLRGKRDALDRNHPFSLRTMEIELEPSFGPDSCGSFYLTTVLQFLTLFR